MKGSADRAGDRTWTQALGKGVLERFDAGEEEELHPSDCGGVTLIQEATDVEERDDAPPSTCGRDQESKMDEGCQLPQVDTVEQR